VKDLLYSDEMQDYLGDIWDVRKVLVLVAIVSIESRSI